MTDRDRYQREMDLEYDRLKKMKTPDGIAASLQKLYDLAWSVQHPRLAAKAEQVK